MPSRNPRPCHTPACPGLTSGAYCASCQTRRRAEAGVPPWKDRRWIACSRAFLRAHPVCAHKQCDRPATEAHHIDGLGPAGPRGYDWANLLPLCKAHHAQITAGTHNRARSRG